MLIDKLGIRKYVKAKVERRDVEFNPSKIYIELKQHVGAPAAALVKKGDKVKVGDIVAQTPPEALGTTMHASVNGTVSEVNNRFIIISR